MASIENKGDAEVGFGISAAILFLCGRENGGAASIVLVVVGGKGKMNLFFFFAFPFPPRPINYGSSGQLTHLTNSISHISI